MATHHKHIHITLTRTDRAFNYVHQNVWKCVTPATKTHSLTGQTLSSLCQLHALPKLLLWWCQPEGALPLAADALESRKVPLTITHLLCEIIMFDFVSKDKTSPSLFSCCLSQASSILSSIPCFLLFSLSLFFPPDLSPFLSVSKLSYITFAEERRKERGCTEPLDASAHESSPLIWSALLAHRYLRHLFSLFKQ